MCFFFLLLLTPTPPPLSQDDAINSNNIQYFERLYDRTNPNGCPATGTFFVSHKYSNYRMVQEVRCIVRLYPCLQTTQTNSTIYSM